MVFARDDNDGYDKIDEDNYGYGDDNGYDTYDDDYKYNNNNRYDNGCNFEIDGYNNELKDFWDTFLAKLQALTTQMNLLTITSTSPQLDNYLTKFWLRTFKTIPPSHSLTLYLLGGYTTTISIPTKSWVLHYLLQQWVDSTHLAFDSTLAYGMDLVLPIYTNLLTSIVVLDINLELPINLLDLNQWCLVQYGLVVWHFV